MKKIIIAIIIIFCQVQSYGQDLEPSQRKLFYVSDSIYANSMNEHFLQNRFILGWHWSNGLKMSTALGCTQAHGNPNNPIQLFKDSVQTIMNIWEIRSADGDPYWVGLKQRLLATRKPSDSLKDFEYYNDKKFVISSMAMQFEPTLKIEDIDIDYFQTNNLDSSKPIFGFKYIHPSLNLNSSRLKLIRNSNLIDSVVLREPSPNFHMYYSPNNDPYDLLSRDSLHSDRINSGERIYLSINLKRSDTDNGSLDPNARILEIKCPFITVNGTRGTIKFDSIPNANSKYQIRPSATDYRGLALGVTPNLINDTILYITQAMLPLGDTSITLSFHFTCDNDDLINNSYLTKKNHDGGGRDIRHLNMDVKYLGNSDVEIDWFRFETPLARDLARGYFDDFITERIQGGINAMTTSSHINKAVSPFRVYLHDEPNASGWFMMRYFNKLIGNIGTAAFMDSYISNQFEYYVNPPENWIEKSYPSNYEAVPFAKFNYASTQTWKTMGLHNGCNYIGFKTSKSPSTVFSFDKLQSGYETSTIGTGFKDSVNQIHFNLPSKLSLDEYRDCLDYRWSSLASYEVNLMKKYLGIEKNTKRYQDRGCSHLFSDKLWWHQSFVGALFDVIPHPIDSTKKVFTLNFKRQRTGEEMRVTDWFAILMGAKGLVYDREQGDMPMLMFGVGNGEQFYGNFNIDSIKSNPWSFLRNDEVGSDFFVENGELVSGEINGKIYFIHELVDFDTVSAALNVPRDRIYIGRKSVRCEIKKIHDWVNANNSTLMDLRLASWYGKGFRVFRKYDEAKFGSTNPIGNIIQTNAILTRPLGRVFADGSPYYEQGAIDEDGFVLDSGFYDITLLRKHDDLTLDNHLFLGVLNRRTDPLIVINNDVHFYTTAEMDEYASKDSSFNYVTQKYQSREYWRNMYWKRLGCREITIPFNMALQKNRVKFDGQLFHVRDLGYDKNIQYDLNLFPWRDERYYDLTDTILTAKSSLAIRFLPGEGKLLEVEKLFIKTVNDTIGNPCNVRDSVLGNNSFSITTDKNGECCFDLYYEYTGTCEFNDFPISIEYSPQDDFVTITPELENATYLENKYDYTHVKTWIVKDFRAGRYKLGTICKDSDKEFYYEVKVGGAFSGDTTVLISSNYFGMRCDSILSKEKCCDPIKIKFNCSENIFYHIGCLYHVTISNYDKECKYYGVAVNKYSNNIYVGQEIDLEIPFSSEEIDLSKYSKEWLLPNRELPYNYCFEFIFLGESLDTLCKKTVCYSSHGLMEAQYDGAAPLDDCYVLAKFSSHEIKKSDKAEIVCHPNPTNNETKISINLPKKSNTKIDVLNIMGENIYEVASSDLEAGLHEFMFRTQGVSSGLYWVRLTTDEDVKTIKLSIIK